MKRWAYLSSGQFGALLLLELLKKGMTPEAIITSSPRPAGRGLKLKPSPVQAAAESAGIVAPVLISADDPAGAALKFFEETSEPPDVLLVVDCSCFIKEPLLSWPRLGCLNAHPSLLPDLRGAAPVPRSVQRGDTRTGTTIFRLIKAMDAGPILRQGKIDIDEADTTGGLLKKLAVLSAVLLEDILLLPDESWIFEEQDEALATFAPKIEAHELEINLSKTAAEVVNKIRAFSPRAWINYDGKRLRLLDAKVTEKRSEETLSLKCGDDKYAQIITVQQEGKKIMPAKDWQKGQQIKVF